MNMWWAASKRLVLGVALVGCVGCTSYVRHGTGLYHDGRYIEAAEVFERTETRLRRAPPQERAEYSLYRGMTLLALGDVHGAQRWLRYTSQVEMRYPNALSPERKNLLARGFADLNQRLAPGPTTGPPNTAVAASQPPPPVPHPPPQNVRTLVPRR